MSHLDLEIRAMGCVSRSIIPKSPPTPCKGRSFQAGHHRFVPTTAEVHNSYYLEVKSVIPDSVVRNDHNNFSIAKDKIAKKIVARLYICIVSIMSN